ncbi:MAG: hypothetical protein IT563_15935 [Alphaproteobacteria bacterium]|nr:hypothetical protein [Alphaproteobacteria bacterium]
MAQELYAILDALMAVVASAAEYLAANQRSLNLIMVFSVVCLALISIAAYARTRPDDLPAPRTVERRSVNGPRPSDPRLTDMAGDRTPVPPVLQVTPTPQPNPLTDVGHRLSRLEESYLQLNREVTHIDETSRDLRHELETLSMRLADLRQEVNQPPIVDAPATASSVQPASREAVPGTALELVPITSRAELVPVAELNNYINKLDDTAKKMDELQGMVEAQRRTLLAVGQVLSQLPDWRKFKASMTESVDQVVSAFEAKSRRSG